MSQEQDAGGVSAAAEPPKEEATNATVSRRLGEAWCWGGSWEKRQAANQAKAPPEEKVGDKPALKQQFILLREPSASPLSTEKRGSKKDCRGATGKTGDKNTAIPLNAKICGAPLARFRAISPEIERKRYSTSELT